MRKIKSYTSFINEGFSDGDIANIFQSAHGAINKDNLIPLGDLIGKKKGIPSKVEINYLLKDLDIKLEHLFYNAGDFLNPIIYWNGPMYHGFMGGDMSKEALDMMQVRKRFDYKRDVFRKHLSENDYESLFSRVDKKILIPTFIDMYSQIPEDQKYNIFTDLYQRSEYGFGMFPKEIIQNVFSLRKKSSGWKKRMREFNSEIKDKKNDDGSITVHRGANDKSSKEENAYSWTLSPETADFFANRFNKGQGKTITKNIDPSIVLDYLSDRGESEVIIFPSSMGIKEKKRIRMFEDFENEPVGIAILGAPAGGKSYAKKLIAKISRLVGISRATDPEIGIDLTVDILRGKLLQLPASDQLDLFYMAYYTMQELSKESQEYVGWFSDIKKTWLEKIAKSTDANIEVKGEELLINGKIGEEALAQLKSLDAEKIIGSLDNYNDYKRIVRAYQQAKQKEASGSKKDIVYDESGDEPEKIIRNMRSLKNDDYVTDVIMIHHDEVTNNLLQNAFRMITGGDGGRDSSASIIDSYNQIDKNLDKYSDNAEVSVTTSNTELQKGEGPAPDALGKANVEDDTVPAKPIDVFVRVKGDSPALVYDRVLKDKSMDDEKINVLKALLKYQIKTPKINVPDVAKKTIIELIGDISDSEALQILSDANSGKLKNKYVFQFGGINDKLLSDAKNILNANEA